MTGDINTLVQKAKEGDSHSFGELYEYYAKDLYGFALYLTGREFDASDCVQNASVKAYKALPTLKKPSSFKSWFFKILYFECLDLIKKRNDLPFEILREAPAPEYDAGLSVDLSRAMARLTDEERSIVTLSVIYGYKSSEIGDMTALNASTVRTKLKRALKKLEKYMTEGE